MHENKLIAEASCILAVHQIAAFDRHRVATSQFTADSQIEKRVIIDSAVLIEEDSDRSKSVFNIGL